MKIAEVIEVKFIKYFREKGIINIKDKMRKNYSIVFAAVISLLLSSTSANFRHRIEEFSFDTAYQEYPLAYNMWGASVGLNTKLKLIPSG